MNPGPPPDDISIDPSRPGIEITRIDPTWEIQKETVKADVFKSGHRCVRGVVCLPLFLVQH